MLTMGMKTTASAWLMTTLADRLDWSEVKQRVDLGAVATALLGPAPGRRGERGRLWWKCPFHDDQNPSFQVDARKGYWKCFGCDEHGDAATLVMKLNHCSFPEAVAYLAGDSTQLTARKRQPPAALPRHDPPEKPPGIPLADALTLVESAAARLWTPGGATGLEYLRGRGLEDETIKAARLGIVPRVLIPKKDGSGTWCASGITIPWLDGDRLTLVKIRQLGDRKPKYGEAFRDRPAIYPAPSMIQPGRPLVICEGELNALLLSQQIGDMVRVITLGSASNRPAGPVLDAMLAAPIWYLALDGDQAGDKNAAAWPARRGESGRPLTRIGPISTRPVATTSAMFGQAWWALARPGKCWKLEGGHCRRVLEDPEPFQTRSSDQQSADHLKQLS